MDGHQLHGRRVGVEPAGALRAAARSALGDLLAQPGQQRDEPEVVALGGLVQRLADVAQVGETTLAPDLAQHPRRHPGRRGRLHHRGHPAPGDQVDPATQHVGDLVGGPVGVRPAPGVDLLGGAAHEAGQRSGAHPAAAVRLLERLEQGQPLDSRWGREDAAPAGDHGRDADLDERPLGGGQVGVAVGDDRDVARLELPTLEGGARGEQAAYVEGQVAGDVRAHLRHGEHRGGSAGEGVAAHRPQPQRRLDRSALEPRAAVVGGHRVHHDLLVAEPGADEQLLAGVEQGGVAAPVDAEALAPVGGAGRLEVRRDVAAAEGVDGLLGVTDQHHRGDAAERPVEDLPLHRVGVLELVDQHHAPALLHAGARRRVLGLQCPGELEQQVVVGQDPEPTLAQVELLADLLGEADAAPDRRGPVGVGGLEAGLRVADRGPGDRQGVGVAEDGIGLGEGEGPQVEVVDHLAHQVVEVLDEPGPGVGVTGDAEGLQHQGAELVGGGDGGGVEAGQRLEDAPVPDLPVPAVADQQAQQVTVGRDVGVPGQGALGLDELGPHPLAQLLAGGAAEGHHEHVVEPRHALDDVAGHERADGPGLAGARAGLEQGGGARGRQRRGADVEVGGHQSGPIRSPPVSSGSQRVHACSASPASSSTERSAPSPKVRRW